MPRPRGNPILQSIAKAARRLDDHDQRLADHDRRLAEHDQDIADLSDALFLTQGVIARAKLRTRLRARKYRAQARARGR